MKDYKHRFPYVSSSVYVFRGVVGFRAVARVFPAAVAYILADSHGKVINSLRNLDTDPKLPLMVGCWWGGSGLSDVS